MVNTLKFSRIQSKSHCVSFPIKEKEYYISVYNTSKKPLTSNKYTFLDAQYLKLTLQLTLCMGLFSLSCETRAQFTAVVNAENSPIIEEVIESGTQNVIHGGVTQMTTIKDTGYQIVDEGGIVIGSHVLDGGTLLLRQSGASAQDTVVEFNGLLRMINGSTISGTTIVFGNLTTDLGSIINNGHLIIDRDFASNLTTGNGKPVMSGPGSLTQKGSGPLSIGENQTFTGSTTIGEGSTLLLKGEGSLEKTSVLQSYGIFDISGLSPQSTTIARILGSGQIILGDSTLVISKAQKDYYSGEITGNGNIKLTNGYQTLGGTNTFMGVTEVDSGILQIGNGRTSGSVVSDITNNGTLMFYRQDTFSYPGIISGQGSLIKLGGGTLTFQEENSYYGNTIIIGGMLKADNDNSISPNSNYYITKIGMLDLNGKNQTVGSYHSSGTTWFNQKSNTAGTVFTVNGDYHGYGGNMVFNTILQGDDSVTDTLHVTGDSDGGTNVKVNNLGGKGSQTVEGIKLITIDGNIDQSTEFRQLGRIVAGAYDYQLVRGGNGGKTFSWYLTSSAGGIDPTNPVPPIDPGPAPIDPVDPELPIPIPTPPPIPPIEPEIPSIGASRPEAGSYISNLAASEMFFTRLEDRGREHIYTDSLTGQQKLTSMWLRSEGRHIESNDSSGQLSTDANRFVVQIGGDIAGGRLTNKDSLRLGIMAGYGNSHSNTHSNVSDYRSKGDVDGYSIGLYGTWFQDADRRSGAWVDTWLQYAWFSSSVRGDGLETEKYNLGGIQSSLESGYAFVFSRSDKLDYILEPQAQIIWNGVKADEHRESNGTVVNSDGMNNIHTRLGLKGTIEIRTGKKAETVWKPYLSLNWHHNTKEYGVRMDDVIFSSSGAKNIGELKAGVEGQLASQLSIWGGASSQFGSDTYRDIGGFIGVHYAF